MYQAMALCQSMIRPRCFVHGHLRLTTLPGHLRLAAWLRIFLFRVYLLKSRLHYIPLALHFTASDCRFHYNCSRIQPWGAIDKAGFFSQSPHGGKPSPRVTCTTQASKPRRKWPTACSFSWSTRHDDLSNRAPFSPALARDPTRHICDRYSQ